MLAFIVFGWHNGDMSCCSKPGHTKKLPVLCSDPRGGHMNCHHATPTQLSESVRRRPRSLWLRWFLRWWWRSQDIHRPWCFWRAQDIRSRHIVGWVHSRWRGNNGPKVFRHWNWWWCWQWRRRAHGRRGWRNGRWRQVSWHRSGHCRHFRHSRHWRHCRHCRHCSWWLRKAGRPVGFHLRGFWWRGWADRLRSSKGCGRVDGWGCWCGCFAFGSFWGCFDWGCFWGRRIGSLSFLSFYRHGSWNCSWSCSWCCSWSCNWWPIGPCQASSIFGCSLRWFATSCQSRKAKLAQNSIGNALLPTSIHGITWTHTHVDEIMTTWPKKMHELLTFMSQCLHDNTRNMDRIEVMKQGQNVMTYNPHHVMPCLIVAILCHAFPVHSVMPCYAIHDQQTSQKQVRPRFESSVFYAGSGPSSENTPQV